MNWIQSILADENLLVAVFVLFLVSPFVFAIAAFSLPRGFRREIPFRILVGLALLSCIQPFRIGLSLARMDHPDVLNYFVYVPLGLMVVFGFARPFSWLDVCVWLEARFKAASHILVQSLLWFTRSHIIVVTILLGAAFIAWFVPLPSNQKCGEMGTVRFRLQTWIYDATYTSSISSNEFVQIVTLYNASQMPKYGTLTFYSRTGGLAEYLGLRIQLCPH
jgi:hypothetical protein